MRIVIFEPIDNDLDLGLEISGSASIGVVATFAHFSVGVLALGEELISVGPLDLFGV